MSKSEVACYGIQLKHFVCLVQGVTLLAHCLQIYTASSPLLKLYY